MPSKEYQNSPPKPNTEVPPGDITGDVQDRTEITLTDKLNKNLLQSFLTRMNASDDALKKFVVPGSPPGSDDTDFQ